MPDQDQDLMQRLGIKPNCPVCQAVYPSQNLKLIKEKNGRYLFYILCPRCSSALANIILNNPLGTSSLYVVTDFTASDLERLTSHKVSPVNCDDVIEIYEKLNQAQPFWQSCSSKESNLKD